MSGPKSGRTMKMIDDPADTLMPLGASKRGRFGHSSSAPFPKKSTPKDPPPRNISAPSRRADEVMEQSPQGPADDDDLDAVATADRIVQAFDNAETETAESLCSQLLDRMRQQINKPSMKSFLATMLISKRRPLVFSIPTVQQQLVAIIRRDFCQTVAKRCPQLAVLACCLLGRALEHEAQWPLDLVEAFLEDSVGGRVWVDHPHTKEFVANILTAFPKIPLPEKVTQWCLCLLY